MRGLVEAELRVRSEREVELRRAVWLIVLGHHEEAKAALHAALALPRYPHETGWARVATALLLGDEDAIQNESAVAAQRLDSYVPDYRQLLACILALIAGDQATAATHLASLEELVADREKFRSGHPAGVADIARGLVGRDGMQVSAGIDVLLGWHLRRARARSDIFNSPGAIVCLDAVAALLSAHRRDLAVEVSAPFRAAQVPILVLHFDEWDGNPLPSRMRLNVTTDLVAGNLLNDVGMNLPAPTTPANPKSRRPPTRHRSATVSVEAGIEELRCRLAARRGSPWQLASWALMLGDVDAARHTLSDAAANARHRWQRQRTPNHNDVREHFKYSLAVSDTAGLRETTPVLQRWMEAQEPGVRRYAHAFGALDLLCDLLSGRALTRADAGVVMGPLDATRVACTALVERSPALLSQSLTKMLEEHAHSLERRSSPPPPICEWAVYIAAAASRLGMEVPATIGFGDDVPIDVANRMGVARLRCDLLGRGLWTIESPEG